MREQKAWGMPGLKKQLMSANHCAKFYDTLLAPASFHSHCTPYTFQQQVACLFTKTKDAGT